jgi:CheY-like chemotaxis protein
LLKKRILVIEDELIVALDLQNALKRLGYIPLGPATSGPEAIEMARETLPDLILMDVELDGVMDGVQASIEIVKERRVPIIYITAYPGTFIRNSSNMVHPFLCAAKPFSVPGLKALLESAFESAPVRVN